MKSKVRIFLAALAAVTSLSNAPASAGWLKDRWGNGPSFKQARKDAERAASDAASALGTVIGTAGSSGTTNKCHNSDAPCSVDEANDKKGPTMENKREPILPPRTRDRMSPFDNPARDLPHPSERGYPRTPQVVRR